MCGIARWQALASAHVKRNVRPAPVVDLQLHGDKGFGLRVGRDVWARSDSRERACPIVRAVAILAADGAAEHIFGAKRLDGVQDLGLLIAHGVGLERDRRLHGGEADELHNVVRHHVAQRAGLIVIAAALLDADRFRHGNLHVIDVAAVPDRLEDAVGEAEHHDVLDGFFAQVMIDAVDLLFVGDFQ